MGRYKIIRERCKGEKWIPITQRYQKIIGYDNKTGQLKYINSSKNPVDINWVVDEQKRLEGDGIECKIEDGVLWRIEPDYIYSTRSRTKLYY